MYCRHIFIIFTFLFSISASVMASSVINDASASDEEVVARESSVDDAGESSDVEADKFSSVVKNKNDKKVAKKKAINPTFLAKIARKRAAKNIDRNNDQLELDSVSLNGGEENEKGDNIQDKE